MGNHNSNHNSNHNNKYIEACKENNFSLVRELLSKGADVNWRDAAGLAGLHFAVRHNYGELLELQ